MSTAEAPTASNQFPETIYDQDAVPKTLYFDRKLTRELHDNNTMVSGLSSLGFKWRAHKKLSVASGALLTWSCCLVSLHRVQKKQK